MLVRPTFQEEEILVPPWTKIAPRFENIESRRWAFTDEWSNCYLVKNMVLARILGA